MNFQYACFISYRHSGEDMRIFVEKLADRLHSKLRLELAGDEGVFLDINRLDTGDIVDAEIEAALCQSCCMILIYTRSYLSADHPYCARELSAMVELERKRRATFGNDQLGLIIPIIITGRDDEIPQILRERIYNTDFLPFVRIGFRNFTRSQSRRFDSTIHDIAERVVECVQLLKDYLTDDCDGFQLPDAEEERVQQLITAGYIDFEDKQTNFLN